MADAQLSVELTAKIDALRDGFNQAVKEAGKWDSATQKALSDVDKGFVKLASDVEKSSNTVSKSLAKAAAISASSGKAIALGSNQAGNALTNLGRVAQDAPFGFIGIQNNLNPLLESFQRLRAESGSNSAALKVLGQSLIGPAGIGIALSVVSSAILIYQQYQQKANKATNDAKKVTDDYIKSLDAVTGAQLKGAQNAQKELTDLSLLYGAYQNANLPLKERQSAYKQLQEIYPQYFGNIKFEKEATDKTKAAYDGLTEAILASARARAASDKITQNESRKLENEQKTIDLQKDQIKNQNELNKAKLRGDSQALSGGSTGGVATNVSDLNRVSQAQQKINENLTLRRNITKDTNLLDEENARLVTYVNTQLEKGAKLQGGFGGALPGKVKPKLERNNNNTLGGLPELLGFGDLSKPFTIQPVLKIAPLFTGISEIQKRIDDLNKSLVDLIENSIGSTVGNIGSAIGEALASGGDVLSAAGTELLKGFGSFLSGYGDLLIEYGAAAILKSKLDAAALIPGAGIGAGIAAIAAGVALKVAAGAINSFAGRKSSSAKGSGITAFASGGIISGPTLGLMGEYAGAKSDPEVVAPLSKLKKMLGQQDAAGNAIMPFGSSQPVVLTQSLELKGTSIVAMIKKVEAQNERKN